MAHQGASAPIDPRTRDEGTEDGGHGWRCTQPDAGRGAARGIEEVMQGEVERVEALRRGAGAAGQERHPAQAREVEDAERCAIRAPGRDEPAGRREGEREDLRRSLVARRSCLDVLEPDAPPRELRPGIQPGQRWRDAPSATALAVFRASFHCSQSRGRSL